MKIAIYGASDDCIEICGVIEDELGWYSRSPWRADIVSPEGDTLRVLAVYDRDGGWLVGAGPRDRDAPMPDWPLTIRPGRGADDDVVGALDDTAVLEVDAPDGSTLTAVAP